MSMSRPCLDCGALTRASRCGACQRTRYAQRPSPSRRGYGSAHQHARAALASTLPAPCGYGCGTWLHADGDWVAAHVVDGDPDAGWLASCRSCNEQAKGRGQQAQAEQGRGRGAASRRNVYVA